MHLTVNDTDTTGSLASIGIIPFRAYANLGVALHTIKTEELNFIALNTR